MWKQPTICKVTLAIVTVRLFQNVARGQNLVFLGFSKNTNFQQSLLKPLFLVFRVRPGLKKEDNANFESYSHGQVLGPKMSLKKWTPEWF